MLRCSPATCHALQGGDVVWQQVQQQQEAQYESESSDNTDVPAAHLADKDSLFVDINGLSVHYKQAYPAKVSHLLSKLCAGMLPRSALLHLLQVCNRHRQGANVSCWYSMLYPLHMVPSCILLLGLPAGVVSSGF